MITAKGKLAFLLVSFLCIVAIGTCLIVDIALNKAMVWSWYPLAAVLFAWVVAAPLTIGGKLGRWLSLLAASLALLPFLWFLEQHTPVKGWFAGIAAPSAVVAVIATWITICIAKFTKINVWFLAAIDVFLYGVVVATVVRVYVSRFLNMSMFSFENLINFFACAALAVLLVTIGVKKQKSG